ncbi:AsmA family protein [Flavobacterium branchiarum]|uniref:AsmA family protein n=1 Tax=Flavobacterium branchiarum TaxID=1114870 RepID=A0ABV5FJI0_9FLAO|nr:AsmA family protein [Flavobacterium branchiarum]MDN3675641.1 AsmA family protein [Flavobacterium branchiarum]
MKQFLQSASFKKYAKRVALFFLGLIGLVLIASGGLAFYFSNNKAEIVSKINNKINDNISGKIHIGDIQYKFLTGFPNLTLALKDVELKDSLWAEHKRTFLVAKEIEVRLNVMSLLSDKIDFHKIEINSATLDLYNGPNGITNTDIFRKKPKKETNESTKTTLVDEISMTNVHFISENKPRNKLFDFEVMALKAKINYDGDNWQTNVFVDTNVKSMAFNTEKGSFAKDKRIRGIIAVDYKLDQNKITANVDGLAIGGDKFDVKSSFDVGKGTSNFLIDIKTKILWKDATNLLVNNISSKLIFYDLKKPIDVRCILDGDFDSEGDPKINVTAVVENNELHIPDGSISDCSFNGKFTNIFKEELGCEDANSAIIIKDFKGAYNKMAFVISDAMIHNLDKPVGTGILKANFDVTNLNSIIDSNLMRFSNGQAKVDFKFECDIVDLYFRKPKFIGSVRVANASLKYIPKGLNFEKTNIQLDFTEQALLIKKFAFKDRHNTVYVEGRVDNFLNLYYDAPEKMLIDWKISSPSIDIKQFIGVIAATQQKKQVAKSTANHQNFSDQLHTVINKCQVALQLNLDKLVYGKLTASNAKATIKLTNSNVTVQNGFLKTSGGTVAFSGVLNPIGNKYKLQSNAQVNNVDITSFLTSFNNFDIKSFEANDIKGKLTTKANIDGLMDAKGDLVPKSATGNVSFNVNNGALVNFEPIVKIGKFAFPFRDVKNITFSDLAGNLVVRGHDIDVVDLRVSSSVLNFDVEGVYSIGNNTKLAMTVPLRNSKNDTKLATKEERDAIRNRGIVLHLLAVDEGGKIKIKWGRKDK